MPDPYRAFHFKVDTSGPSAVPDDAFFVRFDSSTTTQSDDLVETKSQFTITVQPAVDEIEPDLGVPDALDFF